MKTFRAYLILAPFLIGMLFCTFVTKEKKSSPSNNTISCSGKRALLIGVNDYLFVRPKLMGCVNDVNMMRSLLIRKYSFPSTQITSILNEKASRVGILNAFRELIAATKYKDTVLIFYSGHGSQISDSAETDGLDETIIPYDYRDSEHGALPITDKQIANMLNDLSKKTSNITLILDCCHSGGATKDFLTGTEKEIRKDSRLAPAEDDFLPSAAKSLSNTKLKDPVARYVLLAGCRSDQKSYETKSANGLYGGMLTTSLVNKLSATTENPTWPAVAEDLRTYIRQFYNQSPELVGTNKNSYVFGSTYNSNEAYFIVQPAANNGIIVEGGKAQNVTVGSTYKVYPPATLNFEKGSIGMIRISKVFDFAAEAQLISGKASLPNCRAVEETHVSTKGEKLFVSFLGNWRSAASASNKKKMLTLSSVSEDVRYPNIIYYRKNNEVIVYSGHDTIHALEKFPLNQTDIAEELVSSVVRWSKWFRVANIGNQSSKIKTALLFDGSRSISMDAADVTYKTGVEISFSLKNNSSIPVYVYVLVLGDNGDINVYTLNEFKTSGQSISEAIPAGESVSCAMTPTIRTGRSLTRDVLKIFMTSVPTNLKSMEQNHRKSFTNDDAEKDLVPVNGSLKNSTDWTTIEKVIFITP